MIFVLENMMQKPTDNHHQHCCGNDDSKQNSEIQNKEHTHDHNHDDHNHETPTHWQLLTALAILVAMLILEFGLHFIPNFYISIAIYLAAYLLAGFDVLNLAFRKAIRFDFFNEFVLMSVATIGAFSIGAFSEGVAVMVFYSLGEWFQDAAVNNAKKSIKSLLDSRPDTVTLIKDNQNIQTQASEIKIGDIISVKAGEKVALDGILLNEKASFNTAALTGESKPASKYKNEEVLAGMINTNAVINIEVTTLFKDSKLSKILELVQDATARKSKTQLFISKFAKVYTPIVFALALLVILVPILFVQDYVFKEWLYRSLVFLVISCPCALVVSIPLGYFGGIGLASKNGILFKGANFMDDITEIDTVVMDKTGTLTQGVFEVQHIEAISLSEEQLLNYTAAVENHSSHPIAKAILKKSGNGFEKLTVSDVEEIAGYGLSANVNSDKVLVGNAKLLSKFGIPFDDKISKIEDTIVVVAINQKYAGYIIIADKIKEEALSTIDGLHRLGIRTLMLSGDKQSVADSVAKLLKIDNAFGDLLPQDKIAKVEELQKTGKKVAFMGDGLNDAPVITLANVGLAMGGLGSDATIETADVVIQNDNPYKIITAIKIGKITKSIVWQNIALAGGVKVLVLILGAGGLATLWEAVIADVGVALLAILNAIRIQGKDV
ncbi:heavy metal translocating P-type ATPase [Pedobacter arcticus]|uniref:heavy metal translocating P-type ATPase n=1 Tax=Pedobacter arcticus TaxID=752140 RepID=UPI00030B59A2|nr:heavy metal translocating P-type ATPase [Pedobacter arcticus]